jgi:cytochrome b561
MEQMRGSMTGGLDDLQRTLAKIMRVILILSLIAVIVLGVLMMRDVWSGTQGEVYYAGAAMLAISAIIIDKLVKLRGR